LYPCRARGNEFLTLTRAYTLIVSGKELAALLREQLADGSKSSDLVEAAAEVAEIPERSLFAATDALDVRTQRGQWRLPG
jgi:hypothetical protein